MTEDHRTKAKQCIVSPVLQGSVRTFSNRLERVTLCAVKHFRTDLARNCLSASNVDDGLSSTRHGEGLKGSHHKVQKPV
jgi:hypothetical protein